MLSRIVLVLSLLFCVAGSAHAAESAVAPDVGDVFGYVLSAEGQTPVAQSKVRVVPAPGEKLEKRAAGETDKDGLFHLRSQIGDIKSSVAIGRALDSSIASILSGGAKKVEKFVAVSQLVVEVSAPGYQPFYAPVAVSSALADAKHFSVRLQPIYLAPATAKFRSYSNDYPPAWKKSKISISPLVAKVGDEVKLAVAAPSIVLAKEPDQNPFIYFKLQSGEKVIIGFQKVLRLKKTRPDEGIFEREFKIGSNVVPGIQRVSIEDGALATYFAVGAPDALKAGVTAQLKRLNQASPAARPQILDAIVKIWPAAKATVAPYRAKELAAHNENLLLLHRSNASKEKPLAPPATSAEAVEFARLAIARFPRVKTPAAHARQAAKLIVEQEPNGQSQELALQLLWESGLEAEAVVLSDKILSNPKSPSARKFFPYYVRAMSQWKEPSRARETLGQALQFARRPMSDITAGPSKVLVGSKSYDLYDNPLLSSSVGYSDGYAKAAALLYLYAPAAQNPAQDWLATTILARALALSQQPEKGTTLLAKIASESTGKPQFWLARAWCARAAGDKATVAQCVAKLKALNPSDPEIALLSH